jgi:two-component system chemotaxis response regulator CheB
MNEKKIRVLIVEDTLVGQHLLKGLLSEDARFEIAGVVNNGLQAIEFVEKNKPDVVSMDIYMPILDGVEATRRIMEKYPVPIVIVSSFYNPSEVKMSFKILEAGALTILPRPFGPGHPKFTETARNYRNTLKTISEIQVKALRTRRVVPESEKNAEMPGASPQASVGKKAGEISSYFSHAEVIAIGASAGGPQAVRSLLNSLPAELNIPVMVVQHIDKNFAEGYCEWLGTMTGFPVVMASHGTSMQPGHIYLPPGDHHLGLSRRGVISLSKNPPEKGLRPAVSYLFRNVFHTYGKDCIGVILSGMGTDGAEELRMLHSAGAVTFAQDSLSSLVHGMPGEAIRLNAATMILSPEEIGLEIQKIAKQ